MISEQDKQQILDGAYGINKFGRKVKYIGKSSNSSRPCFFIIYDQNDEIDTGVDLFDDFTRFTHSTSELDVIGLWQDKPEPFDLKRALAGEPVKLRGGLKAYIKYVMPTEYKGKYPLNGYIFNPKKANDIENYTWTLEGMASLFEPQHHYDIIGMWKEPEPVSNTVTLTLPCPLKEPREGMWFVQGNKVIESGYSKTNKAYSNEMLKDGHYFSSKKEAQAWLDAMKNNRR